MNNDFDENNFRFVMNPGEVNLTDDSGQKISGNIREYFLKKKQKDITVIEKLGCGDIVKLKRTGKIVVVSGVDYVDKNIRADYVGYLLDDNKTFVLFGQEDIEKKYSINVDEFIEMNGRHI